MIRPTIPDVLLGTDCPTVMDIALEAAEILKKYHGAHLDVHFKTDKFDPVTVADKEADVLIRSRLAAAFPNDKIVSEESSFVPESFDGRVWFVDPIDDTKGFVEHSNTPGIMIGMAESGVPTLGVVYLPFRNQWLVACKNKGAYTIQDDKSTKLTTDKEKPLSASKLVGRVIRKGNERPIEAVVEAVGFLEIIPEGCIGAKIGMIGRKEADYYIHTNTLAGKWDTLAPEVILNEAGGAMCTIDGKPLDYTKDGNIWDRYFVAASSKEMLESLIKRLNEINAKMGIF